MNKAYRLIWSKAKDAWVIVAEIVKGNGGPPPITVTAVMVMAGLALAAIRADALPTGQQVVSGSAAFTTTGNTLTVNNSRNAIINWQGFSIAVGERTTFTQPDALSAVLNRVTGSYRSDIFGMLDSNGRVFLLNPNGILFGAGSQVNVAGLVASSLGMSNSDFLNGNYRFSGGTQSGPVINEGNITTAAGGKVWLIAPQVENRASGIITAPNGDVVLAAGQSVHLVDPNNPEVAVVVSAPTDQALNLGTITAAAGKVDIFGSLVNQQGVISANSAVAGPGGRIFLKSTTATTLGAGSVTSANAGDNGDGGRIVALSDGNTEAHGSISATGGANGGNGGFIETSGKTINFSGIQVNASSQKGKSGLWLIDPTDLNIDAAGATAISGALNLGTSVEANTEGAATFGTVNTTTGVGDITVNSGITSSYGGNVGLTLKAERSIIVNAPITSTAGKLDVTLNAHYLDDLAPGSVSINSNITTNGGNLVAGGGADPTTTPAIGVDNGIGIYVGSASTINTGTGNITLTGTGGSGSADTNQAGGIGVLIAGTLKTTGTVGNVTTSIAGNIAITGVGGDGGSITTGAGDGGAGGTGVSISGTGSLSTNFTVNGIVADSTLGTILIDGKGGHGGDSLDGTTGGSGGVGVSIAGPVSTTVSIAGTKDVNSTVITTPDSVTNSTVGTITIQGNVGDGSNNGGDGGNADFSSSTGNMTGGSGGNGVEIIAAITSNVTVNGTTSGSTLGDINITGFGGDGGKAWGSDYNSSGGGKAGDATGGAGGTGVLINAAVSSSSNVTIKGYGGRGGYAYGGYGYGTAGPVDGPYGTSGGHAIGGSGGTGVQIGSSGIVSGKVSIDIRGYGGDGGYGYGGYSEAYQNGGNGTGGNGGVGILHQGTIVNSSNSASVYMRGTGGHGGYGYGGNVANNVDSMGGIGGNGFGGNGGHGIFLDGGHITTDAGSLTLKGFGGSGYDGHGGYSGYSGDSGNTGGGRGGDGGGLSKATGGNGILLYNSATIVSGTGTIDLYGKGGHGGYGHGGDAYGDNAYISFGGHGFGGSGGDGVRINGGTISSSGYIGLEGRGGEGGYAWGGDGHSDLGTGGYARGGTGGAGIRSSAAITTTVGAVEGPGIELRGFGGKGAYAWGGDAGYYNDGASGFGGKGGVGIINSGTIGTSAASHSIYIKGVGGDGGYAWGGDGGWGADGAGGNGGLGLGGDGGDGFNGTSGSFIRTGSGNITIKGYGGKSGYAWGGTSGDGSGSGATGGNGGGFYDSLNETYIHATAGHGIVLDSATIKSSNGGTIRLYGEGGNGGKGSGGNGFFFSSNYYSDGGHGYGGFGGDGIRINGGSISTSGDVIIVGKAGNGGDGDGGKGYFDGSHGGNGIGGNGGVGVNVNGPVSGGYISITGGEGSFYGAGGVGAGADAANNYAFAGEGFGGDGGTGVIISSDITSTGDIDIRAYGGNGGYGRDGYGGFFYAGMPAVGGDGGHGFRLNAGTISAGGDITIRGYGGNGGRAYGSDTPDVFSSSHIGGDARGGRGGDGFYTSAGTTIESTGNYATIELRGYGGNGGRAWGGYSYSYNGGFAWGGDGGAGILHNGAIQASNWTSVRLYGNGGNGGRADGGSSNSTGGYGYGGDGGLGVLLGNNPSISTGDGSITIDGSGGSGGIGSYGLSEGWGYGGDGGFGIILDSATVTSSGSGSISIIGKLGTGGVGDDYDGIDGVGIDQSGTTAVSSATGDITLNADSMNLSLTGTIDAPTVSIGRVTAGDINLLVSESTAGDKSGYGGLVLLDSELDTIKTSGDTINNLNIGNEYTNTFTQNGVALSATNSISLAADTMTLDSASLTAPTVGFGRGTWGNMLWDGSYLTAISGTPENLILGNRNTASFDQGGVALNAGTTSVSIIADSMTLTGGITAPTVTLGRATWGDIDLGGSDVFGTLGLTQLEIGSIQASTILRIGGMFQNNLINISGAISTHPSTATLALATYSDITQVAGGSLTVSNLALSSYLGNIDLSGANNAIDNLAALTYGSTIAVSNVSGSPLTIGSIDGVNGVQAVYGSITLKADSMDITSGITAGGDVTLAPTTATRGVDIMTGLKVTPTKLELTDTELESITATNLNIGSSTSGDINVNTPVTITNSSNLNLISGGTINQNDKLLKAPDSISLIADNMNLSGGIESTTVTLAPVSANRGVDIMTGLKVTPTKLELTDTELESITATNLNIGSSTSGDINVNTPVTITNSSNLNLISGGTINQASSMSAPVSISLTADNMTLGAAITAPTVSLTRATSGSIDIGGADFVSGTLGLDSAELDFISASDALRIGDTSNITDISVTTNDITLSSSQVTLATYGAVTFNKSLSVGTNNLTLNAGSATQTAGSIITAGGLELLGGSFTLTEANLVDTLAADAALVSFTNAKGLTIGTVNDTTGITTAGAIDLTAVGNDDQSGIVVNAAINSNGGSIALNGTGGSGVTTTGGKGIEINSNIESGAGIIAITGTGGDSSGYGGGVGVDILNSDIISSYGGSISITGTGGYGGSISSGGIGLQVIGDTASSALIETSGDISLTGYGGGFVSPSNSGGDGVLINSATISGGTVNIYGEGGDGTTGTGAGGIFTSSASVIDAGTTISMTGYGGDSSSGDGGAGISFGGSMTSSSGPITLTGTGGTGGGENCSGAVCTGNAGGNGINVLGNVSSGGDIIMAGQGGAGADVVSSVSGNIASGGSGGDGLYIKGSISSTGTAANLIQLSGNGGTGGNATGYIVDTFAIGGTGGNAQGGSGGFGINRNGGTISTGESPINLNGTGGTGGIGRGGDGGEGGVGGIGTGGNGGTGLALLNGNISSVFGAITLTGEGGSGQYGSGGGYSLGPGTVGSGFGGNGGTGAVVNVSVSTGYSNVGSVSGNDIGKISVIGTGGAALTVDTIEGNGGTGVIFGGSSLLSTSFTTAGDINSSVGMVLVEGNGGTGANGGDGITGTPDISTTFIQHNNVNGNVVAKGTITSTPGDISLTGVGAAGGILSDLTSGTGGTGINLSGGRMETNFGTVTLAGIAGPAGVGSTTGIAGNGVSGSGLHLDAPGVLTIDGTGGISLSGITTSNTTGNTAASISITNSGSGDILLSHSGVLTVKGITNDGSIRLDNYGALTLDGSVTSATGTIYVEAHSPLTTTTSGIVNGYGDVTLFAGASGSPNDNLNIYAPVTSVNGNVFLMAGNRVFLNDGMLPAGTGVSNGPLNAALSVVVTDMLNPLPPPPPPPPLLTTQTAALLPGVNELLNNDVGIMGRESTDLTEEDQEESKPEGENHVTEFRALPYCN